MLKRTICISFFLLWLSCPVRAIEAEKAEAFVGQDLRLSGASLISWQVSTGKYALVFPGGLTMSIGGNSYRSGSAVVWLESRQVEYRGVVTMNYTATAYLRGGITIKKGESARTTELSETAIKTDDKEPALMVRFPVSGQIFVTADEREESDPQGLELYEAALAALTPGVPKPVVQPEAVVPKIPAEKMAAKVYGKKEEKGAEKISEVKFSYPVNISPAGEGDLKMESGKAADGSRIATVTQRFYLWQKQDEKGRQLELQADGGVLFYNKTAADDPNREEGGDLMTSGADKAIYKAFGDTNPLISP